MLDKDIVRRLEKLSGTLPDKQVALLLGLTPHQVRGWRRRNGKFTPVQRWTDAEDALLGTETDAVIARKLGRTKKAVLHRRLFLGVCRADDKKRAISIIRRWILKYNISKDDIFS